MLGLGCGPRCFSLLALAVQKRRVGVVARKSKMGAANADALVALLQGSAFAAPALSLLVLCGTPCACRNHGRHGWTSAALAADGPRQSDAVRA